LSADGIKKQFTSDPLGAIANIATQAATGGMAGFENGRIKKGIQLRAADEGLGEITGRNLKRQALNESREAVKQEELRREQDAADQRVQNERMDRSASMGAQAVRASAQSRASGGTTITNKTLGSNSDFLGL
jgi:hypothetical protein